MTTTKFFRFSVPYFIITIIFLVIEILIAKYAGGWVRHYLGDVLVVVLVYAGVKSICNVNTNLAIIGTLIFAYSVEVSQYFKVAELLGFAQGSVPYIVLGNTFSVEDLVCYAIGCVIIFAIEKKTMIHST